MFTDVQRKEYELTNIQIQRQILLRSYCKIDPQLKQRDFDAVNVLYNENKGVIYCSVS